jgi:hypothetical protein
MLGGKQEALAMARFIRLTHAEFETSFLLNVDEVVRVDEWFHNKTEPASLITTRSKMPINNECEVVVLEAFEHIAQMLEAIDA